MASSPDCRDRVRITISRVGAFTGRMVDELVIGSSVWLKLPYGEFTFSDPSPVYVLIAGGTGLAPFASYLEHCLENNIADRTLHLFYGVCGPRHLLYCSLINRCEREIADFTLTLYSEAPGIDGARAGRLDAGMIFAECHSPDTCYYLSGPLAMVTSIGDSLRDLGVAHDRIHIDEW